MNSREISLKRARELKEKTYKYTDFLDEINNIEVRRNEQYFRQKNKILKYFNSSLDDWNDYHWQIKNRITNINQLKDLLNLDNDFLAEIEKVSNQFRFAISPYYLALMSDEKNDPIKLMSIPTINEIVDDDGTLDPMGEEFTNPAGSITRRYPDRLIINVTNMCAMYCRHCQRRRNIGEIDKHTDISLINESIKYIKDNREIRDVLLTGGDAFLLSDKQIEYLLKELRKIDHVEIIRFGTRTPVTIPQRITDNLVNIIKKYHPVYVNTQFNHPYEITEESINACNKLSNAGIVLGNQAVLLKGVNNDKFIMRYLNQKLLTARVRPYYIFHCKHVKGISHFIPTIKEGLEIIDHLRGNTSGLAIPTYILNAPNGLGKIPLLPNYIIEKIDNTYKIRTWENKIISYTE